MDMRFLFPYEYVNKGSRIIIFGLGACGRSYIEQIILTRYAEIIGVMDSYVKVTDYNYPLIKVEDFEDESLHYDYIVIAMIGYAMAYDVYESLLNKGVKKEKLIAPFLRNEGFDRGKTTLNKNAQERLYVVITMSGGLGDAVMELCFYERLLELSPNIVIDIYGEPYCKYIYEDKKNIRRIIDYNIEKISLDDYDIAFQASWGITIQKADIEKTEKISERLATCVKNTYLDMRQGESFLTRIRKAQIMKKNKFWLMGRGEIWQLSENMIKIDLKDDYYKSYSAMRLEKYITINCGADMRRIGRNQSPTKVWPVNQFERFIELFKSRYKDIEVIQLGSKEQIAIPGVDRYIFGESFELIKYIVKYSLLHVDDEGGLVHLATALGTKCIVLFGPTPMDILGYPQNTNICADACPGCFGFVRDWNAQCVLGNRQPVCMSSIKPEQVYEAANDHMKSLYRDVKGV